MLLKALPYPNVRQDFFVPLCVFQDKQRLSASEAAAQEEVSKLRSALQELQDTHNEVSGAICEAVLCKGLCL